MSRERDRRDNSDTGSGTAAATVDPGKRTRTQALGVQRKVAPASAPSDDVMRQGSLPFLDVMLQGSVHDTAAAGVADAGAALPHLDRIQASFGPDHDLSGVRAGVGGAAGDAASRIGAEAFATGDRVAFQRAPDLHTAAHEAAHVVQQRSGIALDGGVGQEGDAHERHADAIADRVVQGASSAELLPTTTAPAGASAAPVQMRRVPGNAEPLVKESAGGDEPANLDAHRKGLKVVIERAEASLRADDERDGTELFKAYMREAMAGLPEDEVVDPGELLVRKSEALAKIKPGLVLGDPRQIEVGARRGTNDRSNLRKLVRNAAKVFDEIIGGARDGDLKDVFGADHVDAAKRKYVKGRRWMIRIADDDKIHSDRSGHAGEVGLGGYAMFHDRILLSPAKIDNPDNPGSVATMIHEAMHAGNEDVDDKGYITSTSFKDLPAEVKLTNAAHFEVVPRRILLLQALQTNPDAKDAGAFVGQSFVPAGTAEGGVTAEPLTPTEEAMRACSEELREAWSHALDIYGFVRDVRVNQRLWTSRLGGGRYSSTLRFWSRVLKLTIHEKTDVNPRSGDPARQPVSDIDLALAEGVGRKLRNAMGAMPLDEDEAADFEEAHSTEAERTAAHSSVASHRDFLKRLILSLPNIAPITGTVDRDMGVVTELGTRPWDKILNPGAADAHGDAEPDVPDRTRPHPGHEREVGEELASGA